MENEDIMRPQHDTFDRTDNPAKKKYCLISTLANSIARP